LGVKKTLLGKLIAKLLPVSIESMFLANQFIHEQLTINPKASIHDAGCGTGQFLYYFHSLGYKNLSGSDPFIDNDLEYGCYKVYKAFLDDVKGTFDVITLNHVIEHVPDPSAYLKTVYAKLNQNGVCLVRTPLAFSQGFQLYGSNWVGLEAPRHLHIFEKNGFKKLANDIGFELYAMNFDGVGWHYLVSEAYSNNISLKDLKKFEVTAAQHAQFDTDAAKANRNEMGDTIAYYLKKK
jgi:SAM-dependent methyltransferase